MWSIFPLPESTLFSLIAYNVCIVTAYIYHANINAHSCVILCPMESVTSENMQYTAYSKYIHLDCFHKLYLTNVNKKELKPVGFQKSLK